MSAPSLTDLVQRLPPVPGVYLMKDEAGDILYIGKARVLRNRVRSYFVKPSPLPKIAVLMSRVRSIDYIETPSEIDALLLEAHLVRRYLPKFNQELKDDKSFPLLKITAEDFPRLHVTRNRTDRRAIYYGPYTDAKLLREAIDLINALFPLRKCQKLPKTACLYYHIGQCLAPCIRPEVKPEYDRLVGEVRDFLAGGKKSFLEYLADRMRAAAAELRFEDAQFYKEQMNALGRLRKKRYRPNKPEAGVGLSASLELKRRLETERVPERVVCFDVSNVQGANAVASRVAFYRELPDKISYRRYKIRAVQGINDYAMIQEAVGRMLAAVRDGREGFIPEVIMIDGGKGHLAAAWEILKREGFEDTALISIAKRFETVFAVRRRDGGISAEELRLERNSPALYLLQKIRDEAHRFAITYHRLLGSKDLSRSALDAVPGIGEKRKRILLAQFDSIEELRRTGVEQLAGIPGMNRLAAVRVWEYFHGHGGGEIAAAEGEA